MNGVKGADMKNPEVDPTLKSVHVSAIDRAPHHPGHEVAERKGESVAKSPAGPSEDAVETEVAHQREAEERCQVPVETCSSSVDGGAIVASIT